MDQVVITLNEKGIRIKKAWLSTVISDFSLANIEDTVYDLIIKSDLRTCSDGLLSLLETPNKCYNIDKSLILQIQSITNIASPKDCQFADTSNRMLKMELTDGVTTCYAIEYNQIPYLSISLVCGTKIAIKNVRVENGLLLLNASNTILLGGSYCIVCCKKQNKSHRDVTINSKSPLFLFFLKDVVT